MGSFYTSAQREMQARFDSVPLADRLTDSIFSNVIDPDVHQQFIPDL